MLIGGEASLLVLLPTLGVADTFWKFYINLSSPNTHNALFSNPYFPDEETGMQSLDHIISSVTFIS